MDNINLMHNINMIYVTLFSVACGQQFVIKSTVVLSASCTVPVQFDRYEPKLNPFKDTFNIFSHQRINSVEQNPSLEFNSRPVSPEMSCRLWNPKVHCRNYIAKVLIVTLAK
jgi:hypothetical protein